MNRRAGVRILLSMVGLAAAPGLAAPSGGLLPAGEVAAQSTAGKNPGTGIQVRSASYAAATGTLTVDMQWNRQELRKRGTDSGHLVLLAHGADGPVAVHSEAVALNRKHRLRHEIQLTADEQALLDPAGAMFVAATHKHDDDADSRFDRAWYDRKAVDGTALPAGTAVRGGADTRDCPGPFEPRSDLSNCLLWGANLASMELYFVNFENATLSTANMSHADLSYANLADSELSGADLSYANLDRTNLSQAIVVGTNLTGAYLCATRMPDDSVSYAGCPPPGA